MKTKHAFIAAHASEHAIRFMCRVLGVAHSWFHARRRAAPKRAERAVRRDRLGAEIREIFEQSKRWYGAPRIHAELNARGFRISKRTVAKLMRENGIRPPRGRRRAPITTDSSHSHAIAPNLLDRNFEAVAPDAVWLADISCITTDEGWLYLAAVKDLATMEIVGWSMAERLKSVLCEEALKMAIRSCRLNPPNIPRRGRRRPGSIRAGHHVPQRGRGRRRRGEGGGVVGQIRRPGVLYEAAAIQGMVQAQYNLGVLYQLGMGVEGDLVEAYVWFTMAGLQGNMAGATASDRINLSLSEEERERGIAKVRRLLGQDI